MKKLVFVMALSLGSLAAIAQDTAERTPADVNGVVVPQEDFSEIDIAELPEAVTAAVATNYPTATINKAYVNGSKQYKLEVSLEDGTSGTLYADESGNWIEM
ncbi:MAG: hypothetical protein AAFX53_16685 [Bacteroidota bacterium]